MVRYNCDVVVRQGAYYSVANLFSILFQDLGCILGAELSICPYWRRYSLAATRECEGVCLCHATSDHESGC